MIKQTKISWAISKDTSCALKAVAIILVLIGHLAPPFLPISEFYIPAKKIISQVGLNIFMFISGYGIYKVYLSGGYSPRHFLVRRFLKTWPLYSISIGMYYIFQVFIFNNDISPASLASHLLGIHVYFGYENDIMPIFHFISAITTLYFLTSLSLFIKKKEYRVILLGLLIIFQSLLFLITTSNIFFIDYYATFLIGVIWALYCSQKKFAPRILLLCVYLFLLPTDSYKMIIFLTTTISLPFLIKLCHSILLVQNLLRRATLWTGSSSYLIYLGHNYFFWKWSELIQMFNSKITVGAITLILTTVWMFILFDTERRFSEARQILFFNLTSRP
ncbi:MAG: hypothetical protein OEM02_10705 [Desulfobulbaceae bacterium]|nr:hypothetical protein [Desulfobulbaceae bacterium]